MTAIIVITCAVVVVAMIVAGCRASSAREKREAKEKAAQLAKELAEHFVGDQSKVGTVMSFPVAPFEVRVKLTKPVEATGGQYMHTGVVEIVYPENWELKRVDISPDYYGVFSLVAVVKGGPELTTRLQLPGNIAPANGRAGIVWTRRSDRNLSSHPL